MKSRDRKFIIAYKFSNPLESIILNRDIVESLEEAYSKIDVNSFIGKGVAIYGCHLIDSVEVHKDTPLEILLDNKLTAFEVETIFENFTLIEGEFTPGIYKFDYDWDYYELKDAFALTRYFDEVTDFDYEHLKFVCRADGIAIQKIEDDEEFYFFERHPLTYFDVYCPLCRQKIMTHKTVDDFYTCQVISLPCQHFVGNVVWDFSGYDIKELDDLRINYEFNGEDLYFETLNGLEKTFIYKPPHNPVVSYWDGSGRRSNYADHFFFLETKPKFRIK